MVVIASVWFSRQLDTHDILTYVFVALDFKWSTNAGKGHIRKKELVTLKLKRVLSFIYVQRRLIK